MRFMAINLRQFSCIFCSGLWSLKVCWIEITLGRKREEKKERGGGRKRRNTREIPNARKCGLELRAEMILRERERRERGARKKVWGKDKERK